MIILRARSLHKRYGSRALCEGVDLSISERDRIGLIGANGAGKTTLLRLLTGAEEPDGGSIERAPRLAMRLLRQEPELDPEQSVRAALNTGMVRRNALAAELEDVLEELVRAADTRQIQQLLGHQAAIEERLRSLDAHTGEHELETLATVLGLPPGGVLVGSLSGGERRRLALARAVLEQPDLLLLDEPTNHLDQAAVDWLEQHLQRARGAFVLVTHDRYLLDTTVGRMLELDRGRLHAYEGSYTEYLEQRAERLAQEAREESRRKAFVRRELRWIRTSPRARTTKSKARIKRFEEAASQSDETLQGDLLLRIPPGPRLGNRVLRASELGHCFGDRWLFRGLDLEIGKGEHLGIVGPNGAGKTTLMEILCGRLEPAQGQVSIGPTVRFNTLPQGSAELPAGRTVLEAVATHADVLEFDGRLENVRAYLERFLFPAELQATPIERLSGGERRRVQLARMLRGRGNFLVFDEPTNDLDLPTLRILEESLAVYPGCVLVISHDRFFLDRVATRILALEGDGLVSDHSGGYEQYLLRRAERSAEPKPRVKARVTPPRAASGARRLTYREQRELERLPPHIEELEARSAALEKELADPSLYLSGASQRARELAAQLQALRSELEQAYERWSELEERLDANRGP